MDSNNWRSQLQNVSRDRIVAKIMATMKQNCLLSGEGGDEEYKIASKFEEKIYNEATSQSDYIRRIRSKTLAIESKSGSNGTMPSDVPSSSAGISRNPQDLASSDSTAQTSISDLQEEVYLKIQVMKDLYCSEILEIYQKNCSRLQQKESPSEEAKPVVAKLMYFKQMLERIIQCLQMSRSAAQRFQKDSLAGLEKQILGVINAYMRKSSRCLELEDDFTGLSL